MQGNQGKPSSRAIGDVGEDAVCGFLEKNGYNILARNFTIRGGELDIVAEKNGNIAFVEVKSRKVGALTMGEEAITKAKKTHIIKAAEAYMLKNNCDCNARFDVAAVELDGGRAVRMKYYVAAFDASN